MCNIERDLLTCNGIKTVVFVLFFNYEKNCIYFLKKEVSLLVRKWLYCFTTFLQ